MERFIKIGPQASNLSGYTSKGYGIIIEGKRVTVEWGKIFKVDRKYYWAGYNLPVIKIRRFGSIKEAERFKAERLTRRNKEGYKRLPLGTNISYRKG
jgi:hypothetical protein